MRQVIIVRSWISPEVKDVSTDAMLYVTPWMAYHHRLNTIFILTDMMPLDMQRRMGPLLPKK